MSKFAADLVHGMEGAVLSVNAAMLYYLVNTKDIWITRRGDRVRL